MAVSSNAGKTAGGGEAPRPGLAARPNSGESVGLEIEQLGRMAGGLEEARQVAAG